MFCLTNEAAEIFNDDWTESLKIQSHVTGDLLIKISGQLAVEFFFSFLTTPKETPLSPAIAKPVSQPPDLSSLDVEVTTGGLASLPFPRCLPCHMYM